MTSTLFATDKLCSQAPVTDNTLEFKLKKHSLEFGRLQGMRYFLDILFIHDQINIKMNVYSCYSIKNIFLFNS